ncbi:MAG: DegT/DnrJ/EryC1/StrS family aminotransferase [Phycisphaeraceae bacterium]|nr:DegT/DnrJ/EryC1/StrS family aminotransferase [Phycisphaeraceae bacterium]
MSQKLALNGGAKAVTKAFPHFPEWDQAERDAVLKVVDSGKWWMYAYTPGELAGEDQLNESLVSQVELAEREFSKLHKVKHTLAVTNGSMALDICMRAIGLKAGDEVITTPYTFFATSSCILNTNAWPVYVDIDPETYNLDPRKIEEAITPRTRAILPVHFAGELCDMDAINAIARKHNLVVIEDAAQAQGVCLEGERYAGSLSLAGTFSLQASKCLNSGEGGLITTNDDQFAEILWSLRHCGRKRKGLWYEHERIGWNARMNELTAALLRPQMRKLEGQNQRRMANVSYFFSELKKIPGLTPIKLHPKATKRNHYLVMIRYNAAAWDGLPRKLLIDALTAEGVPFGSGYTFTNFENPAFNDPSLYSDDSPLMIGRTKPVNYREFIDRCPVAVRACREEALWLTHNLFLGDKSHVDMILEAIRKVKANVGSLLAAAR